MSIPKVIHYCWFGGGEFTPLMKKCMQSWKKFCPDYEIIEWNESNTDLSECQYAQDALKNKKYAFVSDYVRNKVIYEYGGIYLDTDVMLIKSLDPLLEHKAYAGWESEGSVATGLGFGAEKGNPLVKEFLEEYLHMSYLDENGEVNSLIVPVLTTNVLVKHGMEYKSDVIQDVESFIVYPPEYFCPKSYNTGKMKVTDNTYSIHYYTATWHTKEQEKVRRRNVIKFRIAEAIGPDLTKKISEAINKIKK